MIFPAVSGFDVSRVISILVPDVDPSPIRSSGHPRSAVVRPPRDWSQLLTVRSAALLGFLRYEIMLLRSSLSVVSVRRDAWRLQLAEFQLDRVFPSHDIPLTSPSSLEPSPLQMGNGLVATTQFQRGIRGSSTFIQAIAGPKHIATPTQRVRVGVTNIRNVFVGSQAQRYHPALGRFAVHVFESPIGDGGYVLGIGIHHHGP